MAILAQLRNVSPSPFVLAGRVVTMNATSDVHPDGCVCIEDDQIVYVAKAPADLPLEFSEYPLINTAGTIFPGLVELHNHLPYNMLPLWDVPRKYLNRNVWIEQEPAYLPAISWPARILGQNTDHEYPGAIARYAECRALFGGVTTHAGITVALDSVNYFQGLVRNVEAPDDSSWPAGLGHTKDFKPEEIRSVLVKELKQPRAYFYHLSEGTDEDAHQRFVDLDLGDVWAINRNLVCIHCVALHPEDYGQLAASGGMVWSPLSNFLLYGRTADIEAAKNAGVAIALGSDWGPSGSKNLLGELKIAKIAGDHLGRLFSAEELVRMATATPAAMTQWANHIGSIEAGKKADVLVLEGTCGDSYEQLLAADESQVVLVLIDGRARLGQKKFLSFDPAKQEEVSIGGRDFLLDLTETTGTPLPPMSLAKAVAKLTYGLEHIQELGRSFPKQIARALVEESRFGLILDMEAPTTSVKAQIAAAGPIDPSKLYPIELPPITEVDDAKFRPAIRANRNIPDFLRDALG